MDDQESNNPDPRQPGTARLWIFLNSNFGLFVLSSIVVSFMGWAYTEFSQSIEQRELTMESVAKLTTEVSYRIQMIDSYFESECMVEDNLDEQTFNEIRQIYRAAPEYQSIFPENREKDLHMLLWELAALQGDEKRLDFQEAFNSMLDFNADLNKHLNPVENSYAMPMESQVNKATLKKDVDALMKTFAEAMAPIKDELPLRRDPGFP